MVAEIANLLRQPYFDKMVNGARNALETVLCLQGGDKVLVVSDARKWEIGRAFEHSAREMGADVIYYSLPEEARPLAEIPLDLMKDINDAQKSYQIAINAFEGVAAETPFRIKLSTMEMKRGARVGHAPGITKDMMIDGPMNADYKAISKVANKLMGAFKGAREVHITAPAGTDLRLNLEGRPFETDVLIKNGMIGNLPAGEIWCAPVETRGDGVVVCDASIGDLDMILEEPFSIWMKDGAIERMDCGDEQLLAQVRELTKVDRMASVIGELGIGLNPMAKITGNLLEDEKAGRTAHVAFGNNIDMANGKNDSMTHRDFLFTEPTIKVTYLDGGERTLLEKGEVRL